MVALYFYLEKTNDTFLRYRMNDFFHFEMSTFLFIGSPSNLRHTLRILIGKKYHSAYKNYSAYEKYENGHLGLWYIKLTLFKRF